MSSRFFLARKMQVQKPINTEFQIWKFSETFRENLVQEKKQFCLFKIVLSDKSNLNMLNLLMMFTFSV